MQDTVEEEVFHLVCGIFDSLIHMWDVLVLQFNVKTLNALWCLLHVQVQLHHCVISLINVISKTNEQVSEQFLEKMNVFCF